MDKPYETALFQKLRTELGQALPNTAIRQIEATIDDAITAIFRAPYKMSEQETTDIIVDATIKNIKAVMDGVIESEQNQLGIIKITTLENGKRWIGYTLLGEEYLLHLNLPHDQAQFTKDEQIRRGVKSVVGPAFVLIEAADEEELVKMRVQTSGQLGVYVERNKWFPSYAAYHEKYDDNLNAH
jgi:hypothetical protein